MTLKSALRYDRRLSDDEVMSRLVAVVCLFTLAVGVGFEFGLPELAQGMIAYATIMSALTAIRLLMTREVAE